MSPFKEKEINFLKENDLFPPNLKTQAELDAYKQKIISNLTPRGGKR